MKVYSTEVSLIAIFNSLVNLLPLNFLRFTILEVSSLDFEGRVSVHQISRRPVSRIPLDVDFG
ncbi:hypothetical protein RhiirB3_457138 [Rhizophagus irregularis]|nr:hypothetical protein RhiirB3_457138 [Rhizophagus irregularis]